MLINLNNNLCLTNKCDKDIHDNYAARILDAKYEHVDTNKDATDQKHMNHNQCHDRQNVWAKYNKIFDGSLGVYPHQKVHIELLQNLELVHHCVPCSLSPWTKIQKGTSTLGWY